MQNLQKQQDPRVARQTRPLPAPKDDEDESPEKKAKIANFKANFGKMKMEKLAKLSNVTCTYKKLGTYDENGNINMDYFTNDMWEGVRLTNENKLASK